MYSSIVEAVDKVDGLRIIYQEVQEIQDVTRTFGKCCSQHMRAANAVVAC